MQVRVWRSRSDPSSNARSQVSKKVEVRSWVGSGSSPGLDVRAWVQVGS